MDGHNLHGVCWSCLRARRRQLPALFQLVHIPQKAHQALISSGGKGRRLRAQQLQILPPRRAAFHRGKHVFHTSRLQDEVQKLPERQEPALPAHLGKP